MDTKWKSIEMRKMIKEYILKILKRQEVYLIPGIGCSVIAMMLFADIYTGRYYPTIQTIQLGVFLNVFLGIGLWGITSFLMSFQSRVWKPSHDKFYQEWKNKLKKQQWILCQVGAIALAASLARFKYIYDHGWKYANYSTGYVLIITVVLQWIVCEKVVLSYMKRKLEEYMEALEQINKKNLEAALRRDRKSVV